MHSAHIREMSKSKNEEENNKKKIHKNKENVNVARIVLWFRLLIVGDINACSVRAFLFITFSSLHAATRGTAVRTEVMTRVHTQLYISFFIFIISFDMAGARE